MTRILIVDDHEIVRMGLRTLVAGHPGYDVCGEAADGLHTIAEVAKSAPDLVVLDLVLKGGMTGFDVAERIRRIAPATKIVIFSLHDVPAIARGVGADAFVARTRIHVSYSRPLIAQPAENRTQVAKVIHFGTNRAEYGNNCIAAS